MVAALFALSAFGQMPTNHPLIDTGTFNPLAKSWVADGNLEPVPAKRLTLRVYKDGQLVGTTVSGTDGAFHFDVPANEARYELRIQLSEDTEFRAAVSFRSGFPTLIRIDEQRNIYKLAAGRIRSEGPTVSMVNLMAPKKAVQEFQKGRDLVEKKMYDPAIEHLKKALGLYPNYPDAVNQMGIIERQKGNLPRAQELFRKAIETDPKWPEPYVNLARIQMAANDFTEMFKTTGKALEIDPGLGSLHFFQSVGFFTAGNFDAAEKEALLAEQDEKDRIPEVEMILGSLYERRGQKADAAAHYRLFVKQSPDHASAPKVAIRAAELDRELEQSGKITKVANP